METTISQVVFEILVFQVFSSIREYWALWLFGIKFQGFKDLGLRGFWGSEDRVPKP